MLNFRNLWLKITPTKALKESSGKYETAFFEHVYRVVYLAGFSLAKEGTIYLIYSTIVKLLYVWIVFSEVWYLFSMAIGLDRIIENFAVSGIQFITFYRYRTMINNKDTFKKLAMAMESPLFEISNDRRKAILNYWQEKNRKYLILVLGLGSCTLLAWYIYPLVDDIEYNLVTTVRLPFEHATPTNYPIAYILVVIGFQYSAYFVMTNDVIMQVHLMNILCQFAVLSDCFENILEDCRLEFPALNERNFYTSEAFVQKYFDRLGDLVEQHKFILRNTNSLCKILSSPMLAQMAASSMLICFSGYQLVTASTESATKCLMCLLFLGYNMFELFIFCRWCDEIKIKSEGIRKAVYFSGWERMAMVPGVRARVMIIVSRASRPVVLSAGGLYKLSLESYSTIVKTSYSLLSVLLRTRRD